MPSNDSVNDQEILNGFASLHQAMMTGFDQIREEFAGVHGQVALIRADIARLDGEILNLRNDVSRLEQRVLRRFDEVDERLDRHERRITALEAR